MAQASKPAQANARIQIRDIGAEPGQMMRGFLDIGETAAGPIQIPLVIVNGEKDGPVLCLTAGVHATEYSSIEALMRLINELDPKQLSGVILAVPVVNMHMFASRMSFVSPIDEVNLNKIAPGDDGSITYSVCRVLFDEIITKAHYHLDLHAGDFGEILLEFAGFSLTGDTKLDHEGEALARLFTPRVFCLSRDGTTLPPSPGFVAYAAAHKGVISILAEAGGNGTMEEADVCIHMNGIRNIMRYLKMISGEPVIPRPQLLATDWHSVRATRAGLLRLKVTVGDDIAVDQEIAEICDIFGQTVEIVRATRPGLAMLVWSHKVVNTGDPIVRFWTAQPAPPFPATDRFIRSQP